MKAKSSKRIVYAKARGIDGKVTRWRWLAPRLSEYQKKGRAYKKGYEQGKKDADGIKATLLIERDKKARKQTYEEVLKEYKKLIDEAPTISHKDSIDFGCWLEHQIKAME